jgi:hypothetical protein
MLEVPRPKPPETPRQVSVQIPESWTVRLDKIAASMSAAAGGVPVRRADVLRLVIERGMDALDGGRPAATEPATAKAPSKRR